MNQTARPEPRTDCPAAMLNTSPQFRVARTTLPGGPFSVGRAAGGPGREWANSGSYLVTWRLTASEPPPDSA